MVCWPFLGLYTGAEPGCRSYFTHFAWSSVGYERFLNCLDVVNIQATIVEQVIHRHKIDFRRDAANV